MSSAADSEDAPGAAAVAGPGEGSGSSPSAADDAATPPADPSQASSSASTAPRVTPASPGLIFDDPLDRPSSDDTDRGWGDLPSGSADDDFARFLSQKPPHHL